MMTKWTKGPWSFVRHAVGKRGGGGDLQINFSALKFFFIPWTEENEANARLIASAPDLYTALDRVAVLLAERKDNDKYMIFALREAESALRQARGENGDNNVDTK